MSNSPSSFLGNPLLLAISMSPLRSAGRRSPGCVRDRKDSSAAYPHATFTRRAALHKARRPQRHHATERRASDWRHTQKSNAAPSNGASRTRAPIGMARATHGDIQAVFYGVPTQPSPFGTHACDRRGALFTANGGGSPPPPAGKAPGRGGHGDGGARGLALRLPPRANGGSKKILRPRYRGGALYVAPPIAR